MESLIPKINAMNDSDNINAALEITTDDMIIEAADLSTRAYSDTHHKEQPVINDINAQIHGWEPLEATDLGFTATDSRFSKVGNGDGDLLRYDFENASATVGLTILEGKRTLGIAFEGTNDPSTENGREDLQQDIFSIKDYYDSLSVFTSSVATYISNHSHIEQVLVTGHSLGGAAAQSFMHDFGQNDARFIGITFGSPGTIRSEVVPENRFTNIQHDDDLIVKAALLQPKYFVDGSIVISVAKDSGHPLANYSETTEFIASKLDTQLLFRDLIIGTDSADSMTGGLLDNDGVFIGFAGNDTIDGGSGVDTAVYTGPRSSYLIDKGEQDYAVSDQREGSNNDGVDTLDSIERIIFTDSALALDVNQSAGTVAKLIGAIYGAESVADAKLVAIGLSEFDRGTSPDDLAALAIKEAGANSPEQIVSLLWNNVTGTPPTAEQAQPYIDDLNNGNYSAGTLGFLAAETPSNEANIDLVGLQETGLTFDPLVYFG